MKLSKEEWEELFALRGDMEEEADRRLIRRLIRYAETLERKVDRIKEVLNVEEG